MTAIELAPVSQPSPSPAAPSPPPLPSNHVYESFPPMSTMKSKQTSSATFFDDLSYSRKWNEIESVLGDRSRSDAEIGWIEGVVHETRSSQKETEILLVPPSSAESKHDTTPDTTNPNTQNHSQNQNQNHHHPQTDRHDANKALRVFINCTEFSRFVFAINQQIKVSLKGARTIRELSQYGREILPFSLVFSGDVVIQSVRGGVCMPDGIIVDSRDGRDYQGERARPESTNPRLSSDDPGLSQPRTPAHKSSPANRTLNIGDTSNFTSYPPLNSLTEGMMTPILGIVESIKAPSTTISGELCVSLTLADASSYSAKRGFRVTCFTSKSRLGRDLPSPSPGDAILFKSVKVGKWVTGGTPGGHGSSTGSSGNSSGGGGGLFGTVYHNKLDWIVYERKVDGIVLPKHALREVEDGFDVDGFFDVEAKKVVFRQFVEAMENGPWVDENSFWL